MGAAQGASSALNDPAFNDIQGGSGNPFAPVTGQGKSGGGMGQAGGQSPQQQAGADASQGMGPSTNDAQGGQQGQNNPDLQSIIDDILGVFGGGQGGNQGGQGGGFGNEFGGRGMGSRRFGQGGHHGGAEGFRQGFGPGRGGRFG
jgi:hypothetical protein